MSAGPYRDTIAQSELRWEVAPLIWNGVLYTPTTWSVIYAIDLRTKAIKWRWDPGVPRGVADGGPRACCAGFLVAWDQLALGVRE